MRILARALLALGRGGEALRVLREGLGSPPYDPVQARAYAEAHRDLALVEISASRRGRARRLLAAGLKVDPGYPEARTLLADLDRQLGQERPRFQELIAPGPDGTVLPDNLLRYAVWLARWGEFEAAWPYFKILLDERGGTAAVHLNTGLEYWQGQGTEEGYSRAVDEYRSAIALDPGNVEARNHLWQALRVLGRVPEAREEAARFLELDRSHPDAFDAQEFLGDGVGGGGR